MIILLTITVHAVTVTLQLHAGIIHIYNNNIIIIFISAINIIVVVVIAKRI